jgi:hypothetical protein
MGIDERGDELEMIPLFGMLNGDASKGRKDPSYYSSLASARENGRPKR